MEYVLSIKYDIKRIAVMLLWHIYSDLKQALAIVLSYISKSAYGQAVQSRDEINATAERIIDQYGNNILRIAYSYLHNMSDAEDILQETVIRFFNAYPDIESADHEKAWLLRVAINLSKNKIKYNNIRKTDELNDMLITDKKEDLSYLWEAVRSLPERYREVIHLFYHEGYSTAQISKLLNAKEATVRSNLHRGRKQLKAVLEEEYGFEKEI